MKGDEDGNVDEESCGELVWGMDGKGIVMEGGDEGWGWGMREGEGIWKNITLYQKFPIIQNE